MNLYYIIYTSSPAKVIDDCALNNLLTASRDANSRFDITGLLLYFPDSFIQLIEGPRNHIEQLYKNIQKDNRHFRIITLREGPIERRFFPDWTMAFEKRDASEFNTAGALDLHDEKVIQLFSILET